MVRFDLTKILFEKILSFTKNIHLDKLMLPTDWNHVYNSELVKAIRHIRLTSRLYLTVVCLAITAVITTTALNKKLLFFCYFPFETRYEYSLKGYA